MKYKSIVISDLHLGTKDSKIEEVVEFLKENSCQNLFLNGDIIDGWHLQRGGKWRKKETSFMKKIMKLVSSNETRVIYIRGNHDDFLEHFIPFAIGDGFEIKTEHIYESFGKKYLIIHGDVFDTVTSKITWLAYLGSMGYDLLLYLNRRHNRIRAKKGLPYKSLSQEIKKKVKIAINIIFKFENNAVLFAKRRDCDAIICGHIHTPEDKVINGIRYLNSGDWVETKSALVEDHNGAWRILYL